MKKLNKTTLFLILTFVISFSAAGIFRLSGGQYQKPGGMILSVCYMFIPMISVLIVEKLIHKENIRSELHVSFKINPWFFVAWFITPVISFGAFGISLLFADVTYSPDMAGIIARFESMLNPEQIEKIKDSLETLPVHPVWLALGEGLIAGITINAVAGFGEELGWRGFLLKQFENMSFFKASIIIGFIWGIWHAPIILMGHNYPQHPQIGVLMMTTWCILLTPLFVYITIRSRSVIAAAITHGTLNATAGIAIMLIAGGNDLTVGVTGLAGFLSLIIILTVLFIYDTLISRKNIMTNKISHSFNLSTETK
jgi:membrane protease YdiL (CAAX protease family)